MTEIKVSSWGWIYLVIVLDWYTKENIGYTLSLQSKTDQWLDALETAVNSRFSEVIRDTLSWCPITAVSRRHNATWRHVPPLG